MVERTAYIDQLQMFKDKRVIKVVTGIRRCGKSTLLEQMRERIRRDSPKASIISINFEEHGNQGITSHDALYDRVAGKLKPDTMNYVFLDEIQQVAGFENAVNALFTLKNVDIYITGSNAKLLSGEIATLLSGRYVEIRMQPLSYAEFLSADALSRAESATYNDYVLNSTFPYSLELRPNRKAVDIYLDGLYSTLVLKDVAQRRKIQDTEQLERVIKYLFDNIGNVISIQAVSDALSSSGRKMSPQTVERYIEGLKDAYIVYQADRYNIRGREILKSGVKYYAADMGLRRIVLGGAVRDYGRVLENIVYLELIRRYRHVHVGVVDRGEVDFVANSGRTSGDDSATTYYQVAATVRDESTLARELAPFAKIKDSYPKVLITMDDDPQIDHNGIKQINVLKWLTSN